jgi:hypothetical protein
MAWKEVTVTDQNGDGRLTFDEALVAAHTTYSANGIGDYATTETPGYGVSVTKLWGVETFNTLFFINNTGLTTGVGSDTVKDGDYLVASINLDDTYYADWYSYFVKGETPAYKLTTVTGTENTLSLMGHLGMAYSEEDMTDVALVGISIGTWKDGAFEALDTVKTSADGSFSVTFDKAGVYYLTASGTVKDDVTTDWSTGATAEADCPIIPPVCVVNVVDPPRLESLEVYESQAAYNNGDDPIPFTPAFDGEKLTGYSINLPDYRANVFIAAKFPGTEDIIKGRTDFNGMSYTMMTRCAQMGYVWSSSGYSAAVWDQGYLDFYFSGDAGRKLSNYQIDVTQFATLKGLTVDGVMTTAFQQGAQRNYRAYVDSTKDGVDITATGHMSGYTVTIGGQPATNGEALKVPYNWGADGTMVVPITVSGAGRAETTYKLTLEKMPTEAQPTFLVQPEGAEYTVLDEADDIDAMSVVASASGPVTFQWYSNTSETVEGATAIAGATEASYTPVNAKEAGTIYYFCRVTNSDGGQSKDSDLVAVVTYPDPTPVVTLGVKAPEFSAADLVLENGYALTDAAGKPLDTHGYIYKVGDTASELSADVTTPVEGGTLSGQWYYNSRKEENPYYGSSNSAMRNESYTPGTALTDANDTGRWYHYQVSYSFKGKTYTAVSDQVYVFVWTEAAGTPEIQTQPASADYEIGNRVASLRFGLRSGTYTRASYQWYTNTTDSNEGGTPIEGATSSSYALTTPAAEAGTHYYYCVATNSIQGMTASVTSQVATITVTEPEKVEIALEGSGTQEDPYQIATQADLEVVAAAVAEGHSFTGEYLQLTDDITLTAGWSGIGSLKEGTTAPQNGVNLLPFSGTLDGNNKTLSFAEGGKALLKYSRASTVQNLSIYAPYMNDYALLSNYVVDYGEDGVYGSSSPQTISVDNVTLKSGSIIHKGGFLGGYASGINLCTFTNCTVEAGVKIGFNKLTNAPSGQSSVGSFAGDVNGTFANCVSYADVYGVNKVGGICGSKGQAMGPYSVQNSAFYGSITATGDYVGGIAGSGYGSASAPNSPCATIRNCSVAADITGANHVGGIYGGESAIYQCWGTAAIQDNAFTGRLTATQEDGIVGGIVGYMSSLNKYNVIENNFYCADGVERAIGSAKYVDTSSAVHESESGAMYFNTAVELPGISGISKTQHNRTDDPLGADSEILGKKVTAAQMADGTVTAWLNGSETSNKNWVTGENGYPVHGNASYVTALAVSGAYKTEYFAGDSLDLSGLILTATWSDGATTTVALDDPDLSVTGFDSSTRGTQTLTLTYGAAQVQISVTVLVQDTGETITVYFTLLGDTAHGTPTGETGTHTLHGENLETWIAQTAYTAGENDTVWNVVQKVLQENGMTCENPTGNYIKSITRNGVELGEFTNGTYSGWMYTINGEYSELGVNKQYLEDGDVVVLHYTDDYNQDFLPSSETADEAIALIDALPTVEDLTLADSAAVAAANAAFNGLSEADKALVSAERQQKLSAAVLKIAELRNAALKSFEEIYAAVGGNMAKSAAENAVFGNEWAILGLARAGKLSDSTKDAYYISVANMVKENGSAKLHKTKATENARVILALTAIGMDVTDVAGYNLLEPLSDLDYIKQQGKNGPIWALMAFDSHDYEIPTVAAGGTQATREALIEAILQGQLADGGWALAGESADPDMTAMAIQALAPYYNANAAVKTAVDEALARLSAIQNADGGYTSWGSANAESCAQVITALTILGIDPATDARFVKNGNSVLDALLGFYVESGAFQHVMGGGADGMATEQGYYTLAAYSRLLNGQNSLYDMTDVEIGTNPVVPDDNDDNQDQNPSDLPETGDRYPWAETVIMLSASFAVLLVLSQKKRKLSLK